MTVLHQIDTVLLTDHQKQVELNSVLILSGKLLKEASVINWSRVEYS